MRQGAVWTVLVVLIDEDVDEGLELGDGGGLVGLSAEPVLEGLLEALPMRTVVLRSPIVPARLAPRSAMTADSAG
jgi:hypothetical protein